MWISDVIVMAISFLFMLWFFYFCPTKKVRGIAELDPREEAEIYEQEEVCRMSEALRDKIGVKLGDIVTIRSVKTDKKTSASVRRITEERMLTTVIQLSHNIITRINGGPDDLEAEMIVECSMARKEYVRSLIQPFVVFAITAVTVLHALHSDILQTVSISVIIAFLLASLQIRATDYSEPFFRYAVRFFASLREYKILNSKSELPVIITAPHAQAPNADKYTGTLAEMLGKQTGATVIIGKISRLYLDLNRQEANKHPFRKRLRKLVLEKKRPLLILDIHGKKDDKVELGTANGLTADSSILNMVADVLKAYNLDVLIDEHLKGSQEGTIIRSFGRPKDGIHAIQIELPPSLRTPKSLSFISSILASVIKNFCSNTQQ